MNDVGISDYWWLCSPGGDVIDAALVSYDGGVGNDGDNVSRVGVAARPAFNLNLNAVLFTSAAEGGKSSNVGADAIFEIPAFPDGSKENGNEAWKLTLLDSSRQFKMTQDTAIGTAGDTITFDYSNATVGTNEYISAIIADDSGAQYYGRLLQTNSANGTVSLTIPDTLARAFTS